MKIKNIEEKYFELLKLHKELLNKYSSINNFVDDSLVYHVQRYDLMFKEDFKTLIDEQSWR